MGERRARKKQEATREAEEGKRSTDLAGSRYLQAGFRRQCRHGRAEVDVDLVSNVTRDVRAASTAAMSPAIPLPMMTTCFINLAA
jgi:hypothetical protein